MPPGDFVATTVTFDASFFLVGLHYAAAFCCFLSAMLFQQRPGRIDGAAGATFRPLFNTLVGVAYFLHASVLLFFLGTPLPNWVAGIGLVQLVMCWSLVLYFQYHRWELLPTSTLRIVALVWLSAAAVLVQHMQFSGELDYQRSSLLVACAWLVVYTLYYERSSGLISLPVSFRMYALLGFAANAVVGLGSTRPLDGVFLLGGVMTVCQYLFLTLSLLAEHVFGYSAAIWAERAVISENRNRCEEHRARIISTKQLINEAQTHISSRAADVRVV